MLRSFLRIGIGSAQRKTAKPCRSVVHLGKQRAEVSGGQPLVTMMQTANLWKGNDLSRFSRLDRPGRGSVLFQREVRASAVVVVDLRRQASAAAVRYLAPAAAGFITGATRTIDGGRLLGQMR